MKRKILLALGAILILIQFIRPAKNDSDEQLYHISKKYDVPADVSAILEGACNDCHSNKTTYPWYSKIQPVAWWLASHVNDGKRHLNFSEFTNRKIAYQNHKLEETIEMVKEKEMPMPSYTWFGLHPEAKLTDAQRKTLTDWAQMQMDSIKAHYPADSLVLRRPPPPAK
jgi:hypothetical protein